MTSPLISPILIDMKYFLTKQYCVPLFFLILLLVGLNIFKDYGVHWDEYNNQNFGHVWRVYTQDVLHNGSIARTPSPPIELMDWLHGPIVEVSLNFLKNSFKLSDLRDILLFRHFCCFLLFLLGVYFFYLLCNFYFKNWAMALLGCLFLVLSPRIFAHSFYDTVDIPFLSFYILSIYTLLKWLDKKTFLNASVHALACAILIDIRLIGLIIPLITVLSCLPNFKKSIGQLLLYVLLLTILIFLGWPLLWLHPVLNFMKIFQAITHVSFPYSVLYLGKACIGDNLPWHYGPVFLLITTPLFYSFFFFIGFLHSIRQLKRDTMILLVCLFLPLFLTHGRLYDSWRHLFFIYPVFLIFSLMGLSAIWRFGPSIHRFIVLITFLSLSQIIFTMITDHPFQNIYFNRLAGKDMQEIKNKFELDYWGLSYKQALEYILKNDPDRVITIAVDNPLIPLIQNNLNILSAQDRNRFKQVPLNEAKYLLTNYRQHPKEYPYPEYASIKFGNAKILGIYKLK